MGDNEDFVKAKNKNKNKNTGEAGDNEIYSERQRKDM